MNIFAGVITDPVSECPLQEVANNLDFLAFADRSDASKSDSSFDSLSDKENEEGPSVSPCVDPAGDEDDFVELHEDVLEMLGDNESQKVDEFKFHPELVKRWTKILSEGLTRDTKSQLLDVYPRKGNCPIVTPKLNPEIEAIVNDTVQKRDKYLTSDQELCGASISAMGAAIDMIFRSDQEGIAQNDLLKVLLDSGKLMCDLFHQLTKARKAFIYPGLDKKARTLLSNTATGEFLFGPQLSNRIKSASAAQKLGLTLKTQPATKKPFFRSTTLNWKRPPVKSSSQPQAGYRRRPQPPASSQSNFRKDTRRQSDQSRRSTRWNSPRR